jgi:hypothetical protein
MFPYTTDVCHLDSPRTYLETATHIGRLLNVIAPGEALSEPCRDFFFSVMMRSLSLQHAINTLRDALCPPFPVRSCSHPATESSLGLTGHQIYS